MSKNRSSSGIRTLAAMFENQDSASSEARGRSPNGRPSFAGGERPLSKVRASFVAVDQPNNAIEIEPADAKAENEGRHSTASLRRESMSLNESDNKDILEEVKGTIQGEMQARRKSHIIPETVPEHALAATPATNTPAVEAKDFLAAGDVAQAKPDNDAVEETGSTSKTTGVHDDAVDDIGSKLEAMVLPEDDTPASNPDKPVSAVEEEPGQMRPADPKNVEAITSVEKSAQETPKAPETPSKTRSKPQNKTPSKTTKTPVKSSTPGASSSRRNTPSHVQSSTSKTAATSTPKSQPTSPAAFKSGKMSSPAAVKSSSSTSRPTTSDSKASAVPSHLASPSTKARPPRASLTAPTAASAAKSKSLASEGHPAPDAAQKHAPAKSRTTKEPTRPTKMSSHLMAPTASSAAKHEEQKSAAAKSSATSKTAPQNTFRASSSGMKPPKTSTRSSLAGSSSSTTKPAPRTSMSKTGSEGGFLARMTRPTASSSSKTHEKSEVKDAPKRGSSIVKARGDHATKAKSAKLENARHDRPLANGGGSKHVDDSVNSPNETADPADQDAPAELSNGHQIESSVHEDSTSTPAKDTDMPDASPAGTPAFDTATIR